MAATALATFTVTTAAGIAATQSRNRRETKVHRIAGLDSFGGLKSQKNAVKLGLPVCTEQSFANVVSSLKAVKKKSGGALSSTCSAIDEIFKIAAIMNGLTLVGVAVGFVLLRMEAAVEEAAE